MLDLTHDMAQLAWPDAYEAFQRDFSQHRHDDLSGYVFWQDDEDRLWVAGPKGAPYGWFREAWVPEDEIDAELGV